MLAIAKEAPNIDYSLLYLFPVYHFGKEIFIPNRYIVTKANDGLRALSYNRGVYHGCGTASSEEKPFGSIYFGSVGECELCSPDGEHQKMGLEREELRSSKGYRLVEYRGEDNRVLQGLIYNDREFIKVVDSNK